MQDSLIESLNIQVHKKFDHFIASSCTTKNSHWIFFKCYILALNDYHRKMRLNQHWHQHKDKNIHQHDMKNAVYVWKIISKS